MPRLLNMKELETKIVQDGWITGQQLNAAKEEAAKAGRTVWAMLVKLGYVSLDDLTILFAQESNIPYVRITDYKILPSVLCLIGENFCRQNLVIPLFKIKDTLFVACGNPLDTTLVNNLAKLCGCPIEPLFASGYSIIDALDNLYGLEDKTFESGNFILKQEPLEGIPFFRESERLPLNIPVSISLEDASFALPFSSPIDGYSRDISRNGTAVGLEIFLFLPAGLELSLNFKPSATLFARGQRLGLSEAQPRPSGQTIKVKGEIVYCRMEKGQHYFLGIKFSEITEEARQQLFKLTGPK